MEHSGVHIELVLLGILVCFIGYSLFSRALGRTVFTLPIIFTAIGLAASVPISHLGDPEQLDIGKRFLAEITLVLVLFSDASHVNRDVLRRSAKLPLRMLVIGLPLTVVLGTVTVYLIEPGAGWALALLVAAVLTPTDAALGQSVVSNPKVPAHLSQTINVESGLNDGLALPFVVLGALLCTGQIAGDSIGTLALAALSQVLIAPLAGGVVGWFSAWAMGQSIERNWIAPSAQGVLFLATAFAAYLFSVCLGGNGFIAAFVGGMVFGNTYRHKTDFIAEFMEGEGQLLTMASFMAFGALMVPEALASFTGQSVLVALAMLTFVRMVPIWVSLSGTGLPAREKLFLGWFGPRGLASLLFTLLVLEEITLAEEVDLLNAVSFTVLMSVCLHGVTALPFANLIGRHAGDSGKA